MKEPFKGVLLDAYGVFWGGNDIGVLPGAKEVMEKLVSDGKIVGILLDLEHEQLEQLLHDSELLDINVADCITILDAIETKPSTTTSASAWDDDSW